MTVFGFFLSVDVEGKKRFVHLPFRLSSVIKADLHMKFIRTA